MSRTRLGVSIAPKINVCRCPGSAVASRQEKTRAKHAQIASKRALARTLRRGGRGCCCRIADRCVGQRRGARRRENNEQYKSFPRQERGFRRTRGHVSPCWLFFGLRPSTTEDGARWVGARPLRPLFPADADDARSAGGRARGRVLVRCPGARRQGRQRRRRRGKRVRSARWACFTFSAMAESTGHRRSI